MRRLLVIGGLCLWGAGCSLVLVTGGPPSADDGGPMRPGDGGAGMIVDADVDGGEDPDGGDDAALDAEVRDARPDEGVDGTVRDAEMDMGGSPSADLGPDAVADEGIADGAPADAVPDAVAAPDGGDAMVEPDAALCAFEPRCDARIAETCVDGQATQTVCERSERCLNGACEALPEDIYGAVCSIPGLQQECERLGFACGGIAATLFCLHPNASAGPIEIGEECYGPRECVGGGRCTRTGRCATGAEGTLCIDDDDCVGRCVRNACGRAEAESAPNANGR